MYCNVWERLKVRKSLRVEKIKKITVKCFSATISTRGDCDADQWAQSIKSTTECANICPSATWGHFFDTMFNMSCHVIIVHLEQF